MDGKDNIAENYVYARADSPYGITWEEWAIRWWQWLFSLTSKDSNTSINDVYFDPFQEDPNAHFLIGTFGGYAERKYSISSKKSIFFPVINFMTSLLEEPYLENDEKLIKTATSDIDDIINFEAIINGKRIHNLKHYRVSSGTFDLLYAQDNLFGAKEGRTRAVSDGYWIFLKPLPVGKHEIFAAGSCSLGRTRVGVKWDLSIDTS